MAEIVTRELSTDEEQRLAAWEIERMLALGLELKFANELVKAGVSWHDVENLIDAGATPYQVREILL
jgi:hypothetical protein